MTLGLLGGGLAGVDMGVLPTVACWHLTWSTLPRFENLHSASVGRPAIATLLFLFTQVLFLCFLISNHSDILLLAFLVGFKFFSLFTFT